MEFRAPILSFACLVATSACGSLGDPYEEADIPDDFPQLDGLLEGRAELVVDGEMVTTKEGGSTFYDPGGLEPAALPASVSFDYALFLDFLAPDEGTYEAADGELTAEWSDYELNTECGDGSLVIVGSDHVGGYLESRAIWGTLQLELCEFDYDGPLAGRMEISGRFSSMVSEL